MEAAHRWHQTGIGSTVAMIVEVGIAYLLVSRAIDSGSWWEYGFALLFLIGGLRNASNAIKHLLRKFATR